MKTLLISNDPPYGTECVYNAFLLAHALLKKQTMEVSIFLLADAILVAKSGQTTPNGYYNIERMLRRIIGGGGTILLCGTCMDARGISDVELIQGARRSTMGELASFTAEADKVLVF